MFPFSPISQIVGEYSYTHTGTDKGSPVRLENLTANPPYFVNSCT